MIEKIRKEAAPEVVAAVKSGTLSISAAAAVASLPEDEQRAAASAGDDELKQAAKRVRESKRKPREKPTDEVKALREQVADLEAENRNLRREIDALKARLGEAVAGGDDDADVARAGGSGPAYGFASRGLARGLFDDRSCRIRLDLRPSLGCKAPHDDGDDEQPSHNAGRNDARKRRQT
jgi:polyhydroxyalkanoate synthesis regulator phasin